MLNVTHLIQSGGLALIAAVIFAESGMFIGFFFPGDTLLLTAGVFAAQGHLPLVTTIIVVALAAIAGDNVGYQIGRRYGRHLFDRPNGVLFKQEYLHRTEEFFKKYGDRAMLFAHFFPIIRTFAPPVAGIAEMDIRKFFIFDAIGDTVWAAVVTLIGFWFGSKIPNLDHYIVLAVVAVMVITLGPTLYHVTKAVLAHRRNRQHTPED
jgi:membrane-associated protein